MEKWGCLVGRGSSSYLHPSWSSAFEQSLLSSKLLQESLHGHSWASFPLIPASSHSFLLVHLHQLQRYTIVEAGTGLGLISICV